MSFKDDADPAHVHTFRNVVKEAQELSQKIDMNQLTPQEALDKLQELLDATTMPVPKPEKPEKAKATK